MRPGNQKFMTPEEQRAVFEQIRYDFKHTAEVRTWNAVCEHNMDPAKIESEFARLSAPANWTEVSMEDRVALNTLLSCCLRFVPHWPKWIANATDVGFLHPDPKTRGLFWRCVLFIGSSRETMPSGVVETMYSRMGARLGVNGAPYEELTGDHVVEFLHILSAALDKQGVHRFSAPEKRNGSSP